MSSILLENSHNSTYINYNNVYNIVEKEETNDSYLKSILTYQKLKQLNERSMNDLNEESKLVKVVKLSNAESYTEITYTKDFVDSALKVLKENNEMLNKENEMLLAEIYDRRVIMEKHERIIKQSIPTHSFAFLMLNVLSALISFVLILFSITIEDFNLNIVTLLYVILGNIVLIFTSIGSIIDWRKNSIEN